MESARRAPSEHPRRASPRAVRARSGTRRTADGGGRGRLSRLLEEPDHRRDTAAARPPRGGLRPARPHRRHVPGRARSTSRRNGPCSTWRCAHRAARRSWSTARTSCPRCTPCSTGWRTSRIACAAAHGTGTRASGSATSSTSASAVPTWGRSWPTRRSGTTATAASPSGSSRTSTARTSPKRSAISTRTVTLFIVSSKTFTTLETMTNARTARAVVAGRTRRRRDVGREALRRGLDQCRGSGEVRHRHRQHVRVLGLGRRALLHGVRDRPVDDAGDRPGSFPGHARRLPRDGRTLPHRALRAEPAGADGAPGHLEHQLPRRRRRSRCCRTSSTSSAFPPTSSS